MTAEAFWFHTPTVVTGFLIDDTRHTSGHASLVHRLCAGQFTEFCEPPSSESSSGLEIAASTSNKQTAANLLSSVLGMQSQERMGRTNAAVNFFGQLAQMAPQSNLINAFYLLRGQAPPPSIAQQALPLMNQVLGAGPAQAAVQASGVNNATFTPWMSDILGVKAVPTAAPAAGVRR